jgi:hypothetical protein
VTDGCTLRREHISICRMGRCIGYLVRKYGLHETSRVKISLQMRLWQGPKLGGTLVACAT